MIKLKNTAPDGELLEATFLPEQGMNMISFKKGNTEVIDQSTKTLFEERFAGLGALIGPHFHHRNPAIQPLIKDESLFPHIARIKAKGIQDPFSHGIGRYAPWKAEATETKVKASLSSKDLWNGVPLVELEGHHFTMGFQAEMTPQGLKLDLSVVSDNDSLVGIHYYYHLPKGTGTVRSYIKEKFIEEGQLKQIPQEWHVNDQHLLVFDLAKHAADYTFYPFPKPLEAEIELDTGLYRLITKYSCASQENSWQLYHPAGASFVCIEPNTAQDPHHPNLTVSSISIALQIV